MVVDPAELDDLFAAALAETELEARARFVDRACAHNSELRERLKALLTAHEAADSFLKLPSQQSIVPFGVMSESPGRTIGRYKLLEEIGEGGFGVVFMAEQEEPVRRRVALKIIKAGMDSRQIVARFEAERQALAMMDHPNIAKVLDAGATDTGRPYFVMELIKGVSITKYCDAQQLSIPERLALFILVCQAVQHAHQKGIIHRDLKPSNVLVMLHDDKPVPKIIDFGVAKAIEGKLTERTLFTGFHQLMGTPAYMSPEQAQLSGIDVDTRSDIYSLGVLLYELLTGTTPFDSKQLLEAPLDELQRIVREVEPPSPSTRVSTLAADTRITKANERRIDPQRLSATLQGDLDWIVMRCLEKDRSRRYPTANALALDIQRHLDDEPVEARPPTRTYRLRKFIRRNKVGILAGLLVGVAVAAGLGLASVGFVQARRQAQIARSEAARSEEVTRFLQEMLSAAGPSVARGRDTALLREILDTTSERVDQDLKSQPEVQAELQYTLGLTYGSIGDSRRAVEMLRRSVKSFGTSSSDKSTAFALALGALGNWQTRIGDSSNGKANARQGLEIARQVGDRHTIAMCLNWYAHSLDRYLTVNEGIPHFREAIAIETQLGDNPVFLAGLLRSLGDCLAVPGTRAEAETLMRKALAIHRQHLHPDHPAIAGDLFGLAQVLQKLEKWDEAEAVGRQTVELARKIYPQTHRNQWQFAELLGEVLVQRGKWDEAEAFYQDMVDSEPSNGRNWNMLGVFNATRDKFPEAIEQLSRAVQLEPDDEMLSANLAAVLLWTGRTDEYRLHCHQFLERSAGTRDFRVADSAAKAALLLPVSGADFERACQLADFAGDITEPEWALPWVQLGKSLAEYRRQRLESAMAWAGRSEGSPSAGPSSRSSALCIQACCYARAQKRELAEKTLARADQLAATGVLSPKEDFDGDWRDLITFKLLRREAANLIEESSPVP